MDGQTIFAIITGTALACFSLALAGYPLLRRSFVRGNEPDAEVTAPPQSIDEGSDAIGVGLDAIYDSIDTLELDYQLGNVPEGQYRQQLQGYRLQAAMAVREQLERGGAPPELMLEQEVLAARSEIRPSRLLGENPACPECGAPVPPGGAPCSCPNCGASLTIGPPMGGEADSPPAPVSEKPGQAQAW